MSRAFAPAVKPTSLSLRVIGQGGVVAVEKAYGFGAALEWLGPDFDWTYCGYAIPLLAQRILIDGDDFAIGQDRAVSGVIWERSLPASSGAASIAHRLMWRRFSSSVSLPLPTSNMSGSFQWPGPAYFDKPPGRSRSSVMRSQVGLMSPVVRHRLAPSDGPHSQTASQPYWQKL